MTHICDQLSPPGNQSHHQRLEPSLPSDLCRLQDSRSLRDPPFTQAAHQLPVDSQRPDLPSDRRPGPVGQKFPNRHLQRHLGNKESSRDRHQEHVKGNKSPAQDHRFVHRQQQDTLSLHHHLDTPAGTLPFSKKKSLEESSSQ